MGGETGVLEIELFAQSMPGAGLPRGCVAQINAPAHLVFDLVAARGMQRQVVKEQHVSHLQRHIQWRTVAADFSFGLELAVGRRALGDGAETVASRYQPQTAVAFVHVDQGDPHREDLQLRPYLAAVVKAVLVPGKGGVGVLRNHGAHPEVAVGRELGTEKCRGDGGESGVGVEVVDSPVQEFGTAPAARQGLPVRVPMVLPGHPRPAFPEGSAVVEVRYFCGAVEPPGVGVDKAVDGLPQWFECGGIENLALHQVAVRGEFLSFFCAHTLALLHLCSKGFCTLHLRSTQRYAFWEFCQKNFSSAALPLAAK